jgi:hypothetical protein
MIKIATRGQTTTPRIATSGLDESSWDVAPKSADKSDDGIARKEPTGSRSVWSIAWEAHIYFSGTLFVLLAIYCSVNILRLHTFSRSVPLRPILNIAPLGENFDQAQGRSFPPGVNFVPWG